eukprot:27348-Eustigmatos_ZCMA.PRE.1
MASVCEALVPVRVDLDMGGVRIVESMMVDATDDTVTPEQVVGLCRWVATCPNVNIHWDERTRAE